MDTSGCPAPSLTITMMNEGLTECHDGGSFEVQLGAGAAREFAYYVRDLEGNLLSQTQWGRIMGPAYVWAPVMDATGAWLPFGTYLLEVTASNEAGSDTETVTWAHVDYDDVTPPVAHGMLWAGGEHGVEGWYRRAVGVSAGGSDDCGMPVGQLIVDGTPRASPHTVTLDGWHVVQYRAVDRHGLASEWDTLAFGIDTLPPVLGRTSPAPGDVIVAGETVLNAGVLTLAVGGPVTLKAQATDAGSGVKHVEWFSRAADGATARIGVDATPDADGDYATSFDCAFGTHTLYATATDHAGRTAQGADVVLTCVK